MALTVSQPYATAFGFTVNSSYWRWVGLGVDVSSNTATAQLYGYPDAQAFMDGKTPIGTKSYTLTAQDFASFVMQAPSGSTISDAISNAIYSYAKANDQFFNNATEV